MHFSKISCTETLDDWSFLSIWFVPNKKVRGCDGTGWMYRSLQMLIVFDTLTKETIMLTSVKFYHAGCPICVTAENSVVDALDRSRFDVEVVHLGESPSRIVEAENAGVKSVPALLLGSEVLHINHGADLSALK